MDFPKEKVTQVTELLKLLSNENRLMILCLLMEQPLSVSKLGVELPSITQSALSQHLALLKAHGILASQKSGQTVTYFISDHRVEAVIQALKICYCE